LISRQPRADKKLDEEAAGLKDKVGHLELDIGTLNRRLSGA